MKNTDEYPDSALVPSVKMDLSSEIKIPGRHSGSGC